MHDADLELVTAARAGDYAALSKLFDYYLPPVWAFARRETKTDEEARELASAILTTVFDHLDVYRGRVALAAWVLVIARRVAAAHSS